ncbi:MAG: hypothetical protein QOJ29_5034, partial [Thermoleophilaceae bacterium]|nr:hypothetical protein [Thermoleophilaceae bacterium]
VVAALQRAIDEEGRPRFLLKGGTYLQHRLSWSGRPTKDIDGMVRGDIDEFLAALDDALRLPWGPLALTRDAIEVINTPRQDHQTPTVRRSRLPQGASLAKDPDRDRTR